MIWISLTSNLSIHSKYTRDSIGRDGSSRYDNSDQRSSKNIDPFTVVTSENGAFIASYGPRSEQVLLKYSKPRVNKCLSRFSAVDVIEISGAHFLAPKALAKGYVLPPIT